MIRLIGAELFKLRRRRMTKILLYVLLGVLLIMALILLAIARLTQTELGLPMAIPVALSVLSSLGTVLAVILTASSIGSEYSWRTIRTMLTASESRARLLGAKLISAITVILIGMVIGVAAGFVMTLITTAIGGQTLDFSFATAGYMWEDFSHFWRVFYVMLPYISLAFLFSVIGRSAMPGIAMGIGLLFFEPIVSGFMRLAGGWIAEVPDFLLNRNVNVIIALGELPPGLGSGPIGETASVVNAAIVLAVYSVTSIALAFYLFRRRDITG
ncbi:MAG: ABC transporter permease subunit [Dehalococcoidia bacterium]